MRIRPLLLAAVLLLSGCGYVLPSPFGPAAESERAANPYAASADSDCSDDDDDDEPDGETDDDDQPEGDDDDATPPHGDDDDGPEGDDDEGGFVLPAFVNDCGEGLNDVIGDASGVAAFDQTIADVRACSGDVDWYVALVPANTFFSIEANIDGSGSGSSDLDIYQWDATGAVELQRSYTTHGYERLGVYNAGSEDALYWFTVEPYNSASAEYDLLIEAGPYHEGWDCDAFFADTGETGQCNHIMQFPRAETDAQGYFTEHKPHYSNLRREVQYLIRWAAAEVAAEFPGTTPLSLLDMSEGDGDTPGSMVGSLRHPSGTHVNGNDIDVAYYQNGGSNNGEPVCPQNNGQFCTGAVSLLDAERTAYFMAMLYTSPQVRIIGVDPAVASALLDAAQELHDDGRISLSQLQSFDNEMAYGSGWPFHHHHLHFSWTWEDGWWADGAPPEGCMLPEE